MQNIKESNIHISRVPDMEHTFFFPKYNDFFIRWKLQTNRLKNLKNNKQIKLSTIMRQSIIKLPTTIVKEKSSKRKIFYYIHRNKYQYWCRHFVRNYVNQKIISSKKYYKNSNQNMVNVEVYIQQKYILKMQVNYF